MNVLLTITIGFIGVCVGGLLIYAYSAQAVRDNRDIYEAKIERLTKDHEKLVAENTKLMYFINQQQAEQKDFKFGNF